MKSIAGGFNYISVAKAYIRRVYQNSGFNFPEGAKIVPVAHHLAHAASAYYFSGHPSTTVLTMDGLGERVGTTIWKVKDGDFELVSSINGEQGSVGWIYEHVSMALGLGRLEGPGKVMGLAPYGRYDEELQRRFSRIMKTGGSAQPFALSDEFRTEGRIRMVADIERVNARVCSFLTEGLNLMWDPKRELTQPVTSLAWHTQDFTEKIVEIAADWAKNQTGEDTIALAGGVALNAKANMRLHYSRKFNDVFVFPVANDAGGPIGAAAYVYEHVVGNKMKHGRLEDLYLGPRYEDDYVSSIVKKSKLHADFVGEDVAPLADMIHAGNIITWYIGRSEMGPRALGDRSIVANPTKKEVWRALNEIKGREFWRPLAPSVLDEDRAKYFEGSIDHRFMVLMFRMTEEGRQRAPAVCHIDGTARPQSVHSDNKLWHNLIKSFKEVAGEGMVVNTSFNLAGEPLVETPQDAIRSFALGGFDALYIQGWLVKKHS